MQRSKSNEFNKGMDKTTELLGEALVDAIRLAAREEIREALSQGGFSFDDHLHGHLTVPDHDCQIAITLGQDRWRYLATGSL